MSNEIVGLLPILLPLIGGGLAYLAYLKSRTAGAAVVVLFSALLMIAGPYLIWTGKMTMNFDLKVISSPFELDLIEVLDYILIAGFIGLAVYIRKVGMMAYLALVLGIAQLMTILYYDTTLKTDELKAPVATMNIDPLAHIFLLICTVVGGLILIYATKYMEKEKNPSRFFLVMFLFIAAMNGAVFSDNLLWLFFFWEVTTLCSFLLINHDGTELSLNNATTALWMTLLGGVFLIVAISIIAIDYNTYSMSIFLQSSPLDAALFASVALMALAAFTKSAIYPFQKWLVGAMVAPTPVSALLHSATMVNLGIYMLLRITPTWVNFDLFQVLLATVGGFTFLFAAIQAVSQDDAKKMLAYSTISNLGLIVLAIGLTSTLGYTAALMLLFFHAFAKAMLFMSVGVIQKRTHSKNLDDMSGLFARMPFISVMIFIGVMALLTLPFGAFVTKWILLEGSFTYPIIVPFVAFGTTVSVFFYTQWLGRIASEPAKKRVPISYRYAVPLAGLAVCIILSSIFIAQLADNVLSPSLPFVDTGDIATQGSYSLGTVAGFYSTLPLFLVLMMTLLIPALFLRSGGRKQVDPYCCGKPMARSFRGFYFKDIIGDSHVDLPMTAMALVACAFLFIVGVMPA
jgi:ech hydrogenase subunit A